MRWKEFVGLRKARTTTPYTRPKREFEYHLALQGQVWIHNRIRTLPFPFCSHVIEESGNNRSRGPSHPSLMTQYHQRGSTVDNEGTKEKQFDKQKLIGKLCNRWTRRKTQHRSQLVSCPTQTGLSTRQRTGPAFLLGASSQHKPILRPSNENSINNQDIVFKD